MVDALLRAARLAAFAVAAVIAGGPASAAPIDWSQCHLPAFGENPEFAVAACSSILDDSELSEADRERALINRGRALHVSGKLDDAKRDFVAAARIAPADSAPVVRQASIAFTQGKRREAARLAAKALALNPKAAEAYDIIGVVAWAGHDLAAAGAAYDKAIALDPDLILARFHRLQLYISTGQQQKGLREILDVEQALKTTPDLKTGFTDFHGKNIAFETLARLEHATMLESMGRFAESKSVLDRFVADEPGAFSYGWRGWYFFNREKFDLALSDLDKAITYDPDYWILHHLKGRVEFYKNNYAGTVDEETRALALRPERDGSSHWIRSIALRALHRTDEAQKDAFDALWSDHDFAAGELRSLAKQGYFLPPPAGTDLKPAIRTAVEACMLDEKCW